MVSATGAKAAAENPREVAWRILRDIETRDSFAQLAMPAALERSALDARDRALVTELVYGVARRRLALDWLIQKFSGRAIKKIDSGVLDVLRLGIYQLLYMDKIPDHAAVDASVELAKKHFRPGLEKFVNALLRRTARERERLPWPDRDQDAVNYLAVYHSHPRWLVELWSDELGDAATEALLIADNARPRVTLRTNTLKTTTSDLMERLEKAGVRATAGRFTPDSLVVDQSVPAEIFAEGLVYAQDEASILVGRIVGPAAGETVVDIGAGPGGKTTHLAQLMQNRGRLLAVDVSQSRLGLISENCRRLGVGIVETVQADASQPFALPSERAQDGAADAVLVDAPCSGLGVLARRPDARWRKSPEAIVELAELQRRIIEEAARHVRVGGNLIYSVCTITSAETTGIVDAFLAAHPDFARSAFTVDTPAAAGRLEAPAGVLQMLPHIHGTDGMFIAKLRRST